MNHAENLPPSFEDAEQLDEFMTRPDDRVLAAVAESPGDFAVLGAGGKMGFHIGRMLQRALRAIGRTDQILCVSRFTDARVRQAFQRAGLTPFAADLSDHEQVAKLPRSANVFYLAGVKFGTTSHPDLLHQMNVLMPGLVASHFRDSRIVALSTGCVYSFTTPESGGSTETGETDPPGSYAKSCLGREAAFREASLQHSTFCTLVRLNYAIDLRYGVLVDLAQKILDNEPVDLSTGFVNLIWQGDAVAHIIQCLTIAATPPRIINITGSNVLSVRELADGLATRLGRQPRFTGREEPTAWLSNAAASHKLFSPPHISVEQMVDWVADWISRGGPRLGKPTHFENRSGSY